MEKGYVILRVITNSIRKTNVPIGILAYDGDDDIRANIAIGREFPQSLGKNLESSVNVFAVELNRRISKRKVTSHIFCLNISDWLPPDIMATGPFLYSGSASDSFQISYDLYQGIVLKNPRNAP